MPGGTGDEAPVAATSKRLMGWPSKVSPLGCHHSGAVPAAGPGGTDAVPVQNHPWRLFQVVAALVAATAVSSMPTPRPTAAARTTSRVSASRPPLITSRSPSPITAGPGERADRAVPDDDLAVGVGGDPGVVGDQDDGRALLAGASGEQVHHQLPGHR